MNTVRRCGAVALLVAAAFGMATVAGVVGVARAGNAAWYRWESRIDGHIVCAQSSPGSGWQRIAGPYADAGCRRPR